VIDSFPFDKWGEDIAAFWTFGPENSTGTYIMTVLGVIAMIVSLYTWVMLEKRKLEAQAALLRAAGGLPAPAGPTAAFGREREPLAGPSIDPGD
jgi:hypothetical protein